ncbi:MAG: hypothetical protein LBK99_22180 [Opitutaceae bacterium]|nr:hypothetical protein [Opitutaceae bacterium]
MRTPDDHKWQESAPVSPSIMEAIRNSKLSDYDGHTEFRRMTPYERLQWLDVAVTFIEKRRTANPR